MPLLWVCPSSDSAERLLADTRFFLTNPHSVLYFPEREDQAESVVDPERLEIIDALEKERGEIVVTTAKAILQPTLSTEQMHKGRIRLRQGESVDRETLVELLSEEGYQRVVMVERRGEFSLRGGILDIYPVTGEPVRMELFGDEIESLRIFDRDTQRSLQTLKDVEILPAREREESVTRLTDYFPRGSLVCLEESAQLRLHAMEWAHEGWGGEWGDFLGLLTALRTVYFNAWSSPTFEASSAPTSLDFVCESAAVFADRVDGLLRKIPSWQMGGHRVALVSMQSKRLREVLEEHSLEVRELPGQPFMEGALTLFGGSYSEGFRLQIDSERWLEFITDREMMGALRRRRSTRKAERGSLIRLEEIEPGHLVVHLQHGIGRYLGIKSLVVQGHARDLIHLEYSNGDSVYVPVEQLDLIQKYQGLEDKVARLSRMGGQEWAKARTKVREDAEKLARELLRLYAEREITTGHAYPFDTPWQREMEEAFPWQETDDQLRVIEEVKHDLEQARPMDRLVCGDVGYGKTEVALRAAFKAAVDGRQVAILVPTTVLAQQHYQTFSERLAPFPVKIEMMSRFRSNKENKATLDRLAEGGVDIVIGTHRLLSKDVKFKCLGLLVIDEEHRFGVKQKERIKEMRASVDHLAMTATPIPRTLNMALMGVRDMSVIETPPEDRVPIKTFLFEHHPDILKGAITRELAREGQVFLVHNRIEGIERLAQDVRRLVPQARVAVGHGQMDEELLERLLIDFMEGEYDVLVCTTIVESGVDIPNVNTMIINNAHHYGLAQLYQLRGRVGRSSRQAYCYLLYPPQRQLTEDATKRLETIRDFTHLGAGYQIAMRDLEIRGAGDILGSEQSGNIAAVGFDLYCRMLGEAVSTLRGERVETPAEETPVVVEIPVAACLPDDYVPDPRQKVALYKKIAQVHDLSALGSVREELRDRFGPLPEEASNLLFLMEIRLRARAMLIPSVRVKDGRVTFLMPFFRDLGLKELNRLQQLTQWRPQKVPNTVTLGGLYGLAAGPLVYPPPQEMLGKILKVLGQLEAWVGVTDVQKSAK